MPPAVGTVTLGRLQAKNEGTVTVCGRHLQHACGFS